MARLRGRRVELVAEIENVTHPTLDVGRTSDCIYGETNEAVSFPFFG